MLPIDTRIERFALQKTCTEKKVSYRDTYADKQNTPKQTIVLLHGIASGSASWLYQLENLPEDYRVIAWDAPGYGESAPLELNEPDASDYAQSLLEILNNLNISQCYLVGHSLGAIIASRFTKKHSQKVQGLILANPAIGYGAQTEEKRTQVKQAREKTIRTMGPSGLATQRHRHLLSPGSRSEAKELVYYNMSRLNTSGYLQAVYLLAHSDLIKDVAELRLPIDVYSGDQDTITPAAGAKAIANSNKQARYYQINDAGHASYIDQPKIFNALLYQFIHKIKEQNQ